MLTGGGLNAGFNFNTGLGQTQQETWKAGGEVSQASQCPLRGGSLLAGPCHFTKRH